jgi:hypothetical protein
MLTVTTLLAPLPPDRTPLKAVTLTIITNLILDSSNSSGSKGALSQPTSAPSSRPNSGTKGSRPGSGTKGTGLAALFSPSPLPPHPPLPPLPGVVMTCYASVQKRERGEGEAGSAHVLGGGGGAQAVAGSHGRISITSSSDIIISGITSSLH